jgi:hypothetical protein
MAAAHRAKPDSVAIDLRKLYRPLQRDARTLLTTKFHALAERRRAASEGLSKATTVATAALGRLLAQDDSFAKAMGPLIAASRQDLPELAPPSRKLGRPLSREDTLGLLSGSGIRTLDDVSQGQMTMTMAKDVNVDVRVAPFDDAWTDTSGGRHQQQQVWADKATGRFGFLYTIGQEGGNVSCGAGMEVLFARRAAGYPPGAGPPGLVQVRTYTPYSYAWRDRSYLGTAHQHAGFGVLVWSAPLAGGPSRTDLDHEYWTWNDGTSWYDEHDNPGFPNADSDSALQYGNEAPYIPIEPGRLYGAWIWCFAQGDAHGADLTSAAYGQAMIDALAQLIVIGQQ